MGKNRAAAFVAALALALPGTALLGTASAHAAGDQPAKKRAWIQGVVTDQAGHPLDDINVEAVPANDPGADPVASWITYEGPQVGEEHGWFRLYVPAGSYRVRFSSLSDDAEQFRSAFYAEDGATRTLTVLGRQIRELDTTQLVHVGRVASRTTARLVAATVRADQRAVVKVAAVSRFVAPIAGKVRVTVDRRSVATATLVGGAARVVLPRLAPGRHSVTATFLATGTVAQSTSPAQKLTVKRKAGHHRPALRPNAW
jgi:hypothetical protein